jgi:hypothetical protein
MEERSSNTSVLSFLSNVTSPGSLSVSASFDGQRLPKTRRFGNVNQKLTLTSSGELFAPSRAVAKAFSSEGDSGLREENA